MTGASVPAEQTTRRGTERDAPKDLLVVKCWK